MEIVGHFPGLVGDGCKFKLRSSKPLSQKAGKVVWKIEDTTTKEKLIGKFIDLSQMSEKQQQFALGEAQNVSQIQHPNCLRLSEVHGGADQTKVLLVFEYADGGDLATQVQGRAPNKHFKEQEILLIFSQIVMAVRYLHSRSILHRDLTTPNIMLTSYGLCKVSEFGFSRQYDDSVSKDVGQTFCGTPYYVAPEMWKNSQYNSRADIWGLGVILYELMALRRPFTGNSMKELIDKVTSGEVDPLPTHYSPELTQLCRDLLNVDPNARPSAADVLQRPLIVAGLESFAKNVPRLTQLSEEKRSEVIQAIQNAQAPPTAAEQSQQS